MRRIARACRRRAHRWLRPNPKSRGKAGMYGVLSEDPPIIYMSHWNDDGKVQRSMRPLFEFLRDRPAYFFIQYGWQIEEPPRVIKVCRLQEAHLRRYPKHRYLHLCNTPRQLDLFQDAGLPSIFFNNSAAIDERIFCVREGTEKAFDAVYDARLLRYKRHDLATGVPRLALLYARHAHLEDPQYAAQLQDRFRDAHWFNHEPDGSYRTLTPDEVARGYNRCRVGLCLSAVEGVMNASIQYLLCGLPVVSTPSAGGRDLFYDEATALMVDDDPGEVRRGVAQMVAGPCDPRQVRAATVAKVQPHRDRLLAAMQNAYDEQGVDRRAVEDWPVFFKNKLRSGNQSHTEVMERLDRESGRR